MMLDKLKNIEKKHEELTQKLCQPDIINNSNEYKKTAKERAGLEELVELIGKYRNIIKETQDAETLAAAEKDSSMKEFFLSEIDRLKTSKEEMEKNISLLLLPPNPLDKKNIIMEIRAGTGGEEAALFASELFRMYSRLAERRRWKTEVLSTNSTGLGGIKEVVFSVSGDNVYSVFKFESGAHRVQRVPLTESSGRIHTSAVTVAVLPEAEEFDVQISPVDLRIDTFRAGGKGGQHVNKTDSAVRITHIPTGFVVSCQDERSQHQNREKAMRILRAKLLEKLQTEQDQVISEKRKTQVGTGDRSEKIRTYNFPQSRVTDHRVNVTIHNLEAILDGDLDEIIEVLQSREKEEKLKQIS